jgi:hypothetical protein
MTETTEIGPDDQSLARKYPRPGTRKPYRATKLQLLTRADPDRRTNAAKYFDKLTADIEGDLGGNLTTIERALVEAFAGSTVLLDNLNTRLLLGQQIDVYQHSLTASSLVRVGTRLGLRGRLRDITSSTPSEFVDAHYRNDADANEEPGDVD